MANQNARLQRILLQYVVDQQSLNKSVASIRQVSGELGRTGDVAARTATPIKGLQAELDRIAKQRSITALAKDFAAARAAGGDLTATVNATKVALRQLNAEQSDLRQFATEAARFADELERAQAAQGVFQGGRLQGGALGRFGSELRQLPSVQIPGAGFGTDAVANVIRISGAANTAMQAFNVSLAAVAAGGLATVGVIGGLVLIFNKANETFEETRKRIEAFSQALGDVAARTGAGATTKQLQDELTQRQREQASLEEQIDRLNVLRARAGEIAANVRLSSSGTPLNTPELAALNAVNDEIRAITGDQVQNFTQLGAVIEVLQKQANDLNPEIAAINVLLGSEIVALNDAAEAQRLLTEARIAGTQADADEARNNALQNAEFSRLTGEQAEARLAQFRAENQGLEAAMAAIGNSFGASTDMIRDAADRFFAEGQNDIEAITSALQAAGIPPDLITQYLEYRDQLRQNKDDIDRLIAVYYPLALERDREIQALKDTVKASEELNKARVKVKDADTDLAQAYADNAAQIAKINADLLDKQFEIERKAQLAIAEAELDAEQGRTKAVEDANKKRVKAEEKAQDDLLKAQRRYNRDFGNAVANRDALAAFEAKQRYEDEKADVKAALKEQKKEIEDSYKEQLKVVDDRLKDQLRVIGQRKSEELRLAEKAANAALALEAQKHNVEIAMRQQALNAAIQQYNLFLSQLQGAVNRYNGGSVVVPNTIQLPPVASQQAAYNQFAAYQRSQGIPGFRDGLDRVPYDNMLARLHEDETVLKKEDARVWREFKAGGMGGINFAPTIYGTNRRQIRREVDQRLNQTLKAAGVPA